MNKYTSNTFSLSSEVQNWWILLAIQPNFKNIWQSHKVSNGCVKEQTKEGW